MKYRLMFAIIGLIVLVYAVYHPVFKAGFLWDDESYIQSGELAEGINGLVDIWLKPGTTPQYYPLTFSFFWVEYRLWEKDPHAYHLFNVVLHILNVILLFLWFRALGLKGAWFIAATFAVHPVNCATVAWIAEVKNILSLFFILLSFHFLERFFDLFTEARQGNRVTAAHDTPARIKRRSVQFIFGLLFYVAAVLSKSAVVTFPFVIIILLWWSKKRIGLRELLSLIPFFVVSVFLSIMTIMTESRFSFNRQLFEPLTWLERLHVAGQAFWFYICKIVFPLNLEVIYHRWQLTLNPVLQILVPMSVLIFFVMLFLFRTNKTQAVLTAFLVYLVMLAPVLGIIQFNYQAYSFVADHFLYIPGIALIALFIESMFLLFQKPLKLSVGIRNAIFLMVIAVLGWMTSQRCELYHDKYSFWTTANNTSPDGWLQNYNMGTLHIQRKEFGRASDYLRISLEAQPHYFLTHNNIAYVYNQLGLPRKAVDHYQQALSIEPDNSQVHFNIAILYQQIGTSREAIYHLERAVRLEPGMSEAHYLLGNEYSVARDCERALAHYSKAVSLNRTDTRFTYAQAYIFNECGQTMAALKLLDTLIVKHPQNPEYQGLWSWIKATHLDPAIRDGERAVDLARKVCSQTHYQQPIYLDILAVALAEVGDFEQAVIMEGKAIELAQQKGDSEIVAVLEERRQLFNNSMPYHENESGEPIR